MKTNKKLVCHTDLIMEPICNLGREYEVVWDDGTEFAIRNNNGDLHHFDIEEGSKYDYRKWFMLEDSE